MSFKIELPDTSRLMPDVTKWVPPPLPPLPVAYSYSDTQFEILEKYVKEYEAMLDPNHEVGVILTHFGQQMIMQVTEIGYEESVLMIFKGYVNGTMSTLVQHVSQLNFLLTSVPIEEERPKRTIGFKYPDDSE